MKTPIFCMSRNISLAGTSTVYRAFVDPQNTVGSRAVDEARHPSPVTGFITVISLRTDTAPTSTSYWDVSLLVNGVAAATMRIDAGSPHGYYSMPIAISAGDLLSWSFVPSVGPAPPASKFCLSCTISAPEAPMFGGTRNTLLSNGVNYAMFPLSPETENNDTNVGSLLCACPGAVKRIYVYMMNAALPAGSIDFGIAKTAISNTVLLTLNSGSQTGNGSGSVSFSAGDRYYVYIRATGTSGTKGVLFSTAMLPTTLGNSWGSYSRLSGWNPNVTRYYPPQTDYNNEYTTDDISTRWNWPEPGVISDPYFWMSSAFASGAANTQRSLVNSSATGAIAVTVTGPATTGNNVGARQNLAFNDTLGWQGFPSAGTPSGPSYMTVGWVQRVASDNRSMFMAQGY